MPDLALRHLLVKNTAIQMFAQVVSLATSLGTSLVLSRYLGVDGFGQFTYIFAFYYFFLTINDFGVNTIVVREVSKQRERAGEILGAVWSFKLLLAVVSVCAAWATIGLMGFASELRNALCLFALFLPINALQFPTVIFQVMAKLEYPCLIGISNRVLGFMLMMGAVGMGFGLPALVMAVIVSEAFCLLLIHKYSRLFVQPSLQLDPRLWKEILRSSIPLGITMLFVAVINRIDFIMLERMADTQQVGLYAAAYKVTNMLEAFPAMVMATVYPLMSRYAVEDPEKLRVLYRKCMLGLAGVAVPMGIGITLLAPVLVRLLFGPSFSGATLGLQVLVWSTVSLYLAMCGGYVLISLGKERANLWILLAGAVVNVALNLLWIPSWGFIGAAASTAVTYFLVLVSTWWVVRFCLGAKELVREASSDSPVSADAPNAAYSYTR